MNASCDDRVRLSIGDRAAGPEPFHHRQPLLEDGDPVVGVNTIGDQFLRSVAETEADLDPSPARNRSSVGDFLGEADRWRNRQGVAEDSESHAIWCAGLPRSSQTLDAWHR